MDFAQSFSLTVGPHMGRDLNAVLKVITSHLDIHIDIIGALKKLYQDRMINILQCETLRRKFNTVNNKERSAMFILELSQILSFRGLIQSLYIINCTTLAQKLEVERFHRQMLYTEGNEVPSSRCIVNFYSKMKSYCDDNIPLDRLSALTTFSTNLEQKLPNISFQDRQWAADRYATLMQLQVKHYSDRCMVKDVLDRMKTNLPEGVNTCYADILYHCNIGLSYALNNDEQTALDHVRQVQVLSSTSRMPSIRMFCFYHLQYIYRCLYSKNPSQEYLLNQINHCDLALNILMDMNQTDVQLIRRILLLNKTQTLLEITNDFEVNNTIPVKHGSLFIADELLRTVEDNFNQIESRREMIYSLCKARTLQDKDLHTALAYLDRALVLGQDGAYFKKNIHNISAYQNWLLLRELPFIKQVHATE